MKYEEIICENIETEIRKSKYENGAFKFVDKTSEAYISNGKEHRVDGPTYTSKYPNGMVEYVHYCVNGRRHRNNEPACITYYPNGKIKIETYYFNGYLHKKDGPSSIEYDILGNITHEYYYLNNVPFPKFIFEIETLEDLRSVQLDRIMDQYKLNLNNVPKDEAYELLKKVLYFENETLKKYQHPL